AGVTGKALHVSVENMAGWDTLSTPALQNPFPQGHSLICFYAKGYGETRTLSLECTEKDGSRWIAVFPVAGEWTRIVLTPGDFQFWESVKTRGGVGDRLNPENIEYMRIGAAWTHTGPRGGKYEYCIDDLGTAPNPLGERPDEWGNIPRIEGLCPAYKFYPLTDVANIERSQTVVPFETSSPSQEVFSIPRDIKAHHPRPKGKGFNKDREWRWIPLLEAFGSNGEWRGAPAGMVINAEGPMRGSVRTYFSIENLDWYRQPAVQNLLADVVERMSTQVYLLEAGAEFFAYRPGEPVVFGLKAVNFSATPRTGFMIKYDLFAQDDPGQSILTSEKELTLPPGEITEFSCEAPISQSFMPRPGEQTLMKVTTVFQEKSNREVSKVVDRIECDLTFFEPKPDSQRNYITADRGDFWLKKKKWYVHGVNYMPSTGIAIEDQPYFEYWMGKRAYDPEFVQRDLERCKDLGLNSISIFIYHNSIPSRNLFDILCRCENLGLKVNLSIRPGTPMHFDWNQWKEIIQSHRLWEWDSIYAYDIAWEPFFGNEQQRRAYDPQWREWILEKYGSVDQAEKSWGVSAPRYDDQITTPNARHLGQDGPHRKMTADYRHFVDQLIHHHYQDAKEQILSIDPHHLISFRMTVTGDPTYRGDQKMPYDFKSVADCMDFMSPEGYGRIGDWERVKPGVFTVAYARYCAPGKPVLWTEAGVHAWNSQTMQTDPEKLKYQGRFFEDFYRMVLQSYSNGVVWWWHPGGYRYNERSDYGIINPDGTDRPNSRVIRRYADRILAERTIPEPDVNISIDRDADARGLYGIYDRVQDRFWECIDAGKTPGLQ
ncbi:MAG: beta-galactosidase, partial [Candidatus Omnitrophica bacterium]|nr:beta-galactosidase [Candidatus Omnitrophota bacterium]